MKLNYKHTLRACFAGYIVQAEVNSFVPLLFLTFQAQYGIPLQQITLIITVNFLIQLCVDFASAFFIDKIGYRTAAILAHILSSSGLILLTVLPDLCTNAFSGILISVVIYAVGGGLLEVIVSPIAEACPTDNKEQTMSLLHSFYCWGCVGVIGISTLFFAVFGTEKWKFLALVLAVIPAINTFAFARVPLMPLIADGEKGLSIPQLFKNKMFWFFILMMLSAGASEQAVSQWASTFAESALGVSKTVGDITGPLLFSVLMGLSRVIFGKSNGKISLDKMIFFSSILSIASYLLISFSSSAAASLAGVAICGFSVGIMWPGTFSKASASIKNGGTAMFALFALAGDLGCSMGPTFAGRIAGAFGDNLKKGIAAAIVFPIAMLVFSFVLTVKKKNKV